MEDKKSQKAPTIDTVIVTGSDIIQLPKTEVNEVVSDEGRMLSRRHHQNLIQSRHNRI
jgi:hypothetical protein